MEERKVKVKSNVRLREKITMTGKEKTVWVSLKLLLVKKRANLKVLMVLLKKPRRLTVKKELQKKLKWHNKTKVKNQKRMYESTTTQDLMKPEKTLKTILME